MRSSSNEDCLQEGRSLGPGGSTSGELVSISDRADVSRVSEGDVVYIPGTALAKDNVILFYDVVRSGANAILCEQIGRTDHGVLLTNELGVPCISDVTPQILQYEGTEVSVLADRIYRGDRPHTPEEDGTPTVESLPFPQTETEIKANLGFPEVVERQPGILEVTDGVGFMRLEFVLLDILEGSHPRRYVDRYGEADLSRRLADRIEPVVEASSNGVWIRTDDFSVADLSRLTGGEEYEDHEENPMLGWRGVARSIDEPLLYDVQLDAVKRLLEDGYRNIGLFPPMTRFPREYTAWKSRAEEAGVTEISFGVMVETPSAALTFEEVTGEVDFVVFGSNDLTQFTLAIDRGNERLRTQFDETEEAVLKLFQRVISIAKDDGITTCIGGQAAASERLGKKLLSLGIDALSVNPDPRTLSATHRFVAEHENAN